MDERSRTDGAGRIARRLGARLSYANVMATIAVFVALGGSSYAALTIGTEQLRDDAVTSAKIKDGTIVASDIAQGTRQALRGATRQPAAAAKADARAASFDADCNEGLPADDVMVRVGSVCVDKYEASIWTERTGGEQITGAIPCSTSGGDCKGRIYARSVQGVQPRVTISWFQAQQALANSGKRLPTSAEWQAAAANTPDRPAPDQPGPCNTSSPGPVNTGSAAGCVSAWQVRDMVGNVDEWVADWQQASAGCPGWASWFSDDIMCLSGASTTRDGPEALRRGGHFDGSTAGGAYAVTGLPPHQGSMFVGFRGVR